MSKMMLMKSSSSFFTNTTSPMASERSSLLPQQWESNFIEEEEGAEDGQTGELYHQHQNHSKSSKKNRNERGNCHYNNIVWVILGIVLGMLFMQLIHWTYNEDKDDSSSPIQDNNDNKYNNNRYPNMLDTVPSRYTHFQPFGYQLYTGGAPAYLYTNDTATNTTNDNDDSVLLELDFTAGRVTLNPECNGLNSFGHSDDGDDECYLGLVNGTADVAQRLQILTQAVEKAHALSDPSPNTLKVFVAPEFFFRGPDGAYVYHANTNVDFEEECLEICQILRGLETLVAQARFQDWLFLFGTVVVAEELPQEDDYDYLFYNFAPIFKGYDPLTTNHVGKRYILPKRYVSNIDFLTPRRSFNDSFTKELLQEKFGSPSEKTVSSPFDMFHNFYDREMWYKYKSEIDALGYTMIEYDWLILDGITFTIEVCLDHDVKTALTSYLGDAARGSTIRIPSFHSNLERDSVDWVPIPKHLAQISLVSSSGMTANAESMALCNGGTLFLQDGQSGEKSELKWSKQADDVCDRFSWHFLGGSEAFQRFANITTTEARFYYKDNQNHIKVPIYDNEDTQDSTELWKDAIRGVFTTTKYPPAITVYDPIPIAQV